MQDSAEERLIAVQPFPENPVATVRESVISAYRAHLARRYSVQNVRRFSQLASFPEEKIDILRNFFLDRMYPEADQRRILDQAFEKLGSVLKSPRKLLPLMKTAVSSIWKLGTLIPAAIKAGLATFDGYLEIRRLESMMVRYAEENNLHPDSLSNEDMFAGIIAGIPERDIDRFRKDLIRLFESLANVRLLETTVEILGNSQNVMHANAELYDPEELAGVKIGYGLLTAGLDLFKILQPEEIQMLISGVDRIEMDWIESMRKRVSDQAGMGAGKT
ncbi:MAG: hypothetical protein K8S54_20780 [Spirochaetia bacterium]|nr:hypothetical protein [Spirochaetia bacterium]